jgi:hypothetical protein
MPAVGATVAAVLLAIVVLPVVRLLIWPPRPDPFPPQPRPVVPPTAVVAHGVCDGFLRSRVDVSWIPTPSVANGYEVYRSTSPAGKFEFVARVPGRDATSFRDIALGMGKTYYYEVRSVAGQRISPVTEAASAHTPLLCLG